MAVRFVGTLRCVCVSVHKQPKLLLKRGKGICGCSSICICGVGRGVRMIDWMNGDDAYENDI